MRIAMIGSKGIPASEAQGGGIETHVEELSTRLVAAGHSVTVYTRSYANQNGKTSFRGVRIVTLPTISSKHFDTITHSFFATLHALYGAYDILHFHGVGSSPLALIPRIFCPSKKVIVTFHSRDRFHEKWKRFARAYLAFAEWTAVRFPHATIAPSHSIQLFCEKSFHKHVWYIPNGVDVPTVEPGKEGLAAFSLESQRYFFTLSRLLPLKAIEDIIRAFIKVETDMKLVIIGAATADALAYERMLKQLAVKHPRVIFAGRQIGVVLQQLIAHGYAMIHASRIEGLPVAILEAMSYGKLVIMSDIQGNLELVDHSGIAYQVGNISALRDAIDWAVQDPQMVEARGVRARDVVRRLYTWNSVVERTEALYASLENL